jgi:hypothetical protein
LISDGTASFDANIGSITDFQSASVHDASAVTATPLIRNVGVPEAPKYLKRMKKTNLRFNSYTLPLEQAYFHEIRVSSLRSSLAIPAKNLSFDTKPILATNVASESTTCGIVIDLVAALYQIC